MADDGWGDIEVTNGAYFELKKEGDSFEGTITKRDTKLVKFPDEPEAKLRPRLYFADEGDGEKSYTFVNSAAVNAIKALNPPVGRRIKVTRGAKITGSRAFLFTVEYVSGGTPARVAARGADPPAKDQAPF
jgi:hypothetical protein